MSTYLGIYLLTEVSLSGVNLPSTSQEFIHSNLTAAGMGSQKGLVVSGQAVKTEFVNTSDGVGPVTLLGIVTTSVYNGTAYSYSYSLYHDNFYFPTFFVPRANLVVFIP